MYCLYTRLYGVKMKAELMALALLVASSGIILAQTAPWERINEKTFPGLSNLPGSDSYMPLAGSSWQLNLQERILLFGLGILASCVMLACLRHYKKKKLDADFGVGTIEIGDMEKS